MSHPWNFPISLLIIISLKPLTSLAAETPPNSDQGLQIKSLVVQKKSPTGKITIKKSPIRLKTISLDEEKLTQYLKEANEGSLESSSTVPENKNIPKDTGRLHSCVKYQNMPHLMKGCQGEACGQLRYKKAIRSAKIFSEPSATAKEVGNISRCELLHGFEPHLVIQQLGKARVIKPNAQMKKLNVAAGDNIEILQSLGEGYMTACIGEEEVEAYWGGPDSVTEGSVFVFVQPQAESWIKVKSPKGETGFAKDEQFYMGYYDYDPSQFCDGDKPTELPPSGI
jgi:hypothetical protein